MNNRQVTQEIARGFDCGNGCRRQTCMANGCKVLRQHIESYLHQKDVLIDLVYDTLKDVIAKLESKR